MQYLHSLVQDFIKTKFLDVRVNSTLPIEGLQKILKEK